MNPPTFAVDKPGNWYTKWSSGTIIFNTDEITHAAQLFNQGLMSHCQPKLVSVYVIGALSRSSSKVDKHLVCPSFCFVW